MVFGVNTAPHLVPGQFMNDTVWTDHEVAVGSQSNAILITYIGWIVVYIDQLFWTHNDAVFSVKVWNFLAPLAANPPFKYSNTYDVIYYIARITLRMLDDSLKEYINNACKY